MSWSLTGLEGSVSTVLNQGVHVHIGNNCVNAGAHYYFNQTNTSESFDAWNNDTFRFANLNLVE